MTNQSVSPPFKVGYALRRTLPFYRNQKCSGTQSHWKRSLRFTLIQLGAHASPWDIPLATFPRPFAYCTRLWEPYLRRTPLFHLRLFTIFNAQTSLPVYPRPLPSPVIPVSPSPCQCHCHSTSLPPCVSPSPTLPTHVALTKARFPKHFQTKKVRNESTLPFLSNIFAGGHTGTLGLLFACFIISPRGIISHHGFLPLDRAFLLMRVELLHSIHSTVYTTL